MPDCLILVHQKPTAVCYWGCGIGGWILLSLTEKSELCLRQADALIASVHAATTLDPENLAHYVDSLALAAQRFEHVRQNYPSKFWSSLVSPLVLRTLQQSGSSPLVHVVQQHQINFGAHVHVNFVDSSGPLLTIRPVQPEYDELPRILQPLQSLAYNPVGTSFSSRTAPPVGLLAAKPLRGFGGHTGGLRTPFPSGSPRRDVSSVVRPSLVSASGSVRVVGRIPDTGGTCWFCDAAIATTKAEYSGTADPARLRTFCTPG